jgi:hypothetical protein
MIPPLKKSIKKKYLRHVENEVDDTSFSKLVSELGNSPLAIAV